MFAPSVESAIHILIGGKGRQTNGFYFFFFTAHNIWMLWTMKNIGATVEDCLSLRWSSVEIQNLILAFEYCRYWTSILWIWFCGHQFFPFEFTFFDPVFLFWPLLFWAAFCWFFWGLFLATFFFSSVFPENQLKKLISYVYFRISLL
jgi:hypothetical protein